MKGYTELIRHSGNQRMFHAIEMSALATQVDRPLHIHIEGRGGTGKTTVLRAARELLPAIPRIRGCRYNCHPEQPHCPEHFHLSPEEAAVIGIEQIPMPFWEFPPEANVATAVGCIDLHHFAGATHPVASVFPGVLPRANRGILFIDDINRLTDMSPELIKALLEIMAVKPGRVQIEQNGLPTVQIPVQVSVWAASDPDKPGPLEKICKPLADSFDMVIRLGRPTDLDVVQQVLQQSQSYRVNPRQVICTDPAVDLRQLQQRLGAAAAAFDQIRMSEMIKNIIANIYLDFGIQSLRVVEAMELGSRLHAALENRKQVQTEDLVAILPLALAHRVNRDSLEKVLGYLDYVHFLQSSPTLAGTIRENLGLYPQE